MVDRILAPEQEHNTIEHDDRTLPRRDYLPVLKARRPIYAKKGSISAGYASARVCTKGTGAGLSETEISRPRRPTLVLSQAMGLLVGKFAATKDNFELAVVVARTKLNNERH